MENIVIDLNEAKKLYPSAPDWLKKKITDQFGLKNISDKIIDRIKTFEDALAEKGKLSIDIYNNSDEPWIIALKKLVFIIEVINEEWEPDFPDNVQEKWWPYFVVSPGFGFHGSLYICDLTHTSALFRLCFSSEEKSNYCGKQFEQLYKEYLIK